MRVTLIGILTLALATPLGSQERFSFFHASSPESVQRMLTLAELQDDDVLMDLGSGNGIIPLTAAKMNPRLRGRGVDIDAKLVEEANQRARSEGVADRVRFEHGDAFDVDLSDVTVVTMWLYPELMRLLRPIILERARPGTRVVTSTWDLGSWPPDRSANEETAVHLWIVPARIAGGWHWDLQVGGRTVQYAAFLEQRFQTVEGVARAGQRRELLGEVALRGADISFTLDVTIEGVGLSHHVFSGVVEGDEIVGSAKVSAPDAAEITLPWRARRVERSDYFAPAGAIVSDSQAPKPIDATPLEVQPR
jgi:hypothetical protein